ncbi:MAG TPA: AAA family ATPase [Chlamydiales bacterium]|nr:AAA family ATPase [Chlamydiales bacterium]
MIARIIQLAGLSSSPELDRILSELIKSAKEGHLCHRIEDVSALPPQLSGEGKPLVLEGNRLYLQRNWALETLILQKVSALLARTPQESLVLDNPENLQEAQRNAVTAGFKKMFALFTGGPGAGKTFTAGCFIRLLAAAREKPLKVALAAPTGKAAAHLESMLRKQGSQEKIKCEATTLHRLLKLQPGMQRLRSEWTIDADLVVVDEASMLDAALLLHLLNAIGPNTRLLLLGDPDQLPPVEGGALFAELADLFGERLEGSLRMGSGELLDFSKAIRAGKIEKKESEAVLWLGMKEPSEWVDWLIPRLPNPIFSSQPLQPREQKNFQVLCALRQGPSGSDALNREILAHFERKLEAGCWLMVPIMILENDAKQQLYNGTTGVLVRPAFQRQALAYFEGGKTIPESELPRYEIAFCLSVHKSQGSEYEEVALLFPPGSENLGREALYTGVTRAKRRVHIAIDDTTLENLLKVTAKKRSGFTERFAKFRQLARGDETSFATLSGA